ncbi:hypothetical protein ACIQLJ_02245 [Microbacterium sp. NPDC091313]
MTKIARVVAGLAVAAGVFALTGCAADPDVTSLDAELASVPAVNAAETTVSHPGAPWNTEILVTLFVSDTSDQTVIDAVRGAAPVLAADPDVSRHTVSIGLLPGEPADYPSASDYAASQIVIGDSAAAELGIASGEFARLSPDDLERLAGDAR